MEEDEVHLGSCYDTMYGFILAQEVSARAALFVVLDHLWFYARKGLTGAAAGNAPIVEEKATSNTGPTTAESAAAYDVEQAAINRCQNCHSRLVRVVEGKRKCGSCGVELV